MSYLEYVSFINEMNRYHKKPHIRIISLTTVFNWALQDINAFLNTSRHNTKYTITQSGPRKIHKVIKSDVKLR